MKKALPYHPFIFRDWLLLGYLLCISCCCVAQNSNIRCYFNTPVNTNISSGLNAAYLQGCFPDTIAAYINRAKYSIDIAMYNFTAFPSSNVARIASAANAASARGVTIRWLYNGTSATNNIGLSLLSAGINKFASANYAGYIMHNKFMVIDVNSADSNDAILQTGSYNWSDQQTTGDNNNIIFIQSRQVALAYYQEFNKMWGSSASEPVAADARFSIYKTASDQTSFLVNGTAIEVYFSPKDSLGKRLQTSISTANEDLFFGIYTFTDNAIANLVKNKYNSGVRVRGIMDEFSLSYNAYSILSPVLGSNLLIQTGDNLYHDKVMLIDALNPSSDPTVFTGSFNWTGQGQNSNDENAIVIHDPLIANQYYQSLCNNYTGLGGLPCVAPPCAGNNALFVSNRRGSSYQWQVNSGAGFSTISNGTAYSGTTTNNLQLLNPPSNWYGYQYRCLVNGNTFSDTIILKFTAYWNGSTSTAWENPLNWNCNVLPDANTDVVVNSGVHHYPIINANTACRSVQLNKQAIASIMPGVELLLMGL